MELPRCKLCNGLLRPHVVWFGETLSRETLDRTDDALQDCDLLLVAGTSSVVWVGKNLRNIALDGSALLRFDHNVASIVR